MGHEHDHHIPDPRNAGNRRRLIFAIGIIGFGVVVQGTGAIVSGSLALLADSGHMLSDLIGLVIALLAAVIAAKPPTQRLTFGRRRFEVFAAMFNGLALSVIAVTVAIEGVQRLVAGPESGEVGAGVMLIVGIFGGLCNVAALLIISGGAKDSINMRGAYLEVLGDLLGSVAVVIAAVVVLTTGFEGADAIASLVIAAMIVPRAYSLLTDVFHVLAESAPHDTDLDEVRAHIVRTPGVVGVHDVHAWQITPGETIFSAHIVVDSSCDTPQRSHELLDELDTCLREHFRVVHPTFQIETAEHANHEEQSHR